MLKNKRVSLAITILAVLLLGLCSNSGLARSLGQRATDVLYSRGLQSTGNIQIITIDAESEEEYGYFTEWDRSRAADLIRALNQPDSKPAVIAFDINYVTNRSPEGDAAFVEAAKEAGNVIIASRAKMRTKVEEVDGELVADELYVEGYEYPYEALKALTRTNQAITESSIKEFIETLEVSEEIKKELRVITPHNYTGI